MNKYQKTLLGLHEYCKNENYKGYSLYDSHNGKIPFEKFGSIISFYTNQLFKRSPINLRRLAGVEKGINPKGMGLFLLSYSKLKKLKLIDDSELDELNKFFFEWLINNPSEGYTGYSWGYNYDWPHRTGDMFYKNTPSSVVTGFNCRAMMEYYSVYKDERVKEVIRGAAKFIKKDIILTETEFGLCYSYTPARQDLTVNASLLAAEVLAYDDFLNDKREHTEEIKGVLDFTLHFQNSDGSWYYKHELETYEPKKQIDFHQGYVVEIMRNILSHTEFEDVQYSNSIKKGLDFYYNNQFDDKGRALWRLPKVWPIDIHNQSQGIITFSKFSSLDENYIERATKILDWTIQNMLSPKGFFYYQKYSMVTNKTPYLRWNQGWMMVALATYLETLEKRQG